MRITLYLMLILLCVLLSCNSNEKVDKDLNEAEKIMTMDYVKSWNLLNSIDSTHLSVKQKYRLFLLLAYHKVIYANPIYISKEEISRGDSIFSGRQNPDEIKWNIIKAYDAKLKSNYVVWMENLKDAEFIAIQLDRKPELGFIYLYLSQIYDQGFNGTVARYYADKAVDIFKELNYLDHLRNARMAVVGSIIVQKDYKTALDSMISMKTEVMANATDSYKTYFLDQLARSYDENGMTDHAIEIWHDLYDGKPISSNTLAHWAYAYMRINQLDSALTLINKANELPHNSTDEYLCRNVEYLIFEKMGKNERLPYIDSLRQNAALKIGEERQLEQSSLSVNKKYDSATREAWGKVYNARFHTLVSTFVTIISLLVAIIIRLVLRKRNRMLKLEHENDVLKIQTLQNNLFESDNRNKDINSKISAMFQTRFNLLDSLALTYFESKDTGQEQKRIYNDVKRTLNNFNSPEALHELDDLLNGYYDNIMEKFKSDFPKLSSSQYRLALYIFSGFSLPSISIFTDTDLRNIYVYKSRLKSLISKSKSLYKNDYMRFFE